MKRSPRGSSVTRTIREETIDRVLEGGGPHACIAWTGTDWADKTPCKGFFFSPTRALMCYVIPEVVVRVLKIFPGAFGTPMVGPGPQDEQERVLRSQTEQELLDGTTLLVARQKYFRVLQRWTRIVKITGLPETEYQFLPNQDDYQVIVFGSYLEAQHGVLSAQPDFKGGRFLVALGVSPSKVQAAEQKTKLKSGQPGGAVVAAAAEFKASNPSELVGAGVPVRGEPPRVRIGATDPLKVFNRPSGRPADKTDLLKILNMDPANPKPYRPGG